MLNRHDVQTKPKQWFETLALCLVFGVGQASQITQAIWIASAVGHRDMEPAFAGWIASAELVVIALSMLLAGRWRPDAAPNRIVAVMGITAFVGNLVAVAPSIYLFAAGRLVSGLGIGAMLAQVTAISAKRPDAQRVLALMQGSALVISIGMFLVSPLLTTRGPSGVILVIGILALIAGGLGSIAFSRAAPTVLSTEIPRPSEIASGRLGMLSACCGLALAGAAQSAVGSFFLLIGQHLGFDPAELAHWFAFALPVALVGPIAAHVIGERFGLLAPLIGGQMLLAANILTIVHPANLELFGISVAMMAALTLFYLPYAVALMAGFDRSGRAAGAAVASVMLGTAVGPKLGSIFITRGDVAMLGTAAAGLVLTGMTVLVCGLTVMRRGRKTLAPSLEPQADGRK